MHPDKVIMVYATDIANRNAVEETEDWYREYKDAYISQAIPSDSLNEYLKYLDYKIEARSLIRAHSSSGKVSMGIYSRNAQLLNDLVNSNTDWALFQNRILIGYIKSGKLVWLEGE